MLVDEMTAGLWAEPKSIPCKFFYDEAGCRIYERICSLPEYYPTRTELAILRAHADEMARAMGEGPIHLVEYGSGSVEKTRLLLDRASGIETYVPLDIAEAFLLETARAVERAYPALRVMPHVADYTKPFALPAALAAAAGRRIFFFPGSTVGNLDRPETLDLLRRTRRLAGSGGGLLIGLDLEKDRAVLEAAYDDPAGVTAEFNLNLLARLNRERDATFDLSKFAHRARYEEAAGRIAMYLESLADQTVTVSGRPVSFRKGEWIHTESSHKYDLDDFRARAREAGLRPAGAWTDSRRWFAVEYYAVD